MKNRTLTTELLLDLASKISELAITRLGVDRDTAKDFGEAAAGMIADDWGGQSVYIPMDTGGVLAARNARIYGEFTGDNVSALAKEHGTSVQNIYRILKSERAKHAPQQHSLFDTL